MRVKTFRRCVQAPRVSWVFVRALFVRTCVSDRAWDDSSCVRLFSCVRTLFVSRALFSSYVRN